MYEKPELTRVGDAEDVILGVTVTGDDLDMNWTFVRGEFEAETIPDES